MVKSVFGAKSAEGADVHLVRAGTGLRRCRVAEGFSVTDPAQTDGTPAGPPTPLAGPISGQVRSEGNCVRSFRLGAHAASVERTLMSWIRTAVSLIGFGFAIVQFFDRMQQMSEVNPRAYPDAPRYLGLSLIFAAFWRLRFDLGIPLDTSLPVGWRLHPDRRNDEGRNADTDHCSCSLLILIGMFAFFAVLLRFV